MMQDPGRQVKDIIAEMNKKVVGAKKDASEKRWLRNKWRKYLEVNDAISKSKTQKMIKKFQAESSKVRNSLVEKNDKAVVF